METRRGRSFARDGIVTVATTALTIALGLVTGVIIARSLGPNGRGSLAAVLTAPQVLGWIFALGSGTAASFYLSRDPTAGAKLLATWLVLLIPVGALAIIAGEAILPLLLSAQPDATLRLARLYMPSITLVLLSDVAFGLLLGDQDFLYLNLLKFTHPAGITAIYAMLWMSGRFSVASALVAQAIMSALVLAAAILRAVRRHGLAGPDYELGRRTFWYALKSHGAVLGAVVTQRLDMLIIPAFLTAASVGHYAVATNVASIVISISGALAMIVMPAATRRGGAGRELVVRTLQATFVIGLLLCGGLFLFADLAIKIIYGMEFEPAVLPLRMLLPGAVLYAGTLVLLNGLYAEGRPFTATVAQTLGMMVTAAGLFTFLRAGGILAAAVVSTVSCTLTFAIAALLYRQASRLGWRDFMPQLADGLELAQHLRFLIRDGIRQFARREQAGES